MPFRKIPKCQTKGTFKKWWLAGFISKTPLAEVLLGFQQNQKLVCLILSVSCKILTFLVWSPPNCLNSHWSVDEKVIVKWQRAGWHSMKDYSGLCGGRGGLYTWACVGESRAMLSNPALMSSFQKKRGWEARNGSWPSDLNDFRVLWSIFWKRLDYSLFCLRKEYFKYL